MTALRPVARLLAGAMAAALAGCAQVTEPLGYYWQSANGHLQLLAAARPVDDWLQNGATPERLKQQLQLAQRLRNFGHRALALPDNPSYTRYADLQREAAVWNVVAAPPLSLTLKTWCYPVTGCVSYQGWFDEARARAQAQALREQGWEATVYPVPAYSTLGWSNWLGGDPLLNTFIGYGEGDLARIVFHELAHQVLFAKDDTLFNESYATAVERLGASRWLAQEGSAAARQAYADAEKRREAWRGLKRQVREQLAALYAQTALPAEERLARKAQVLAGFRADYRRLREGWGGDPARWRLTDRWVEEANNASLGAEAAYDALVPGFEALFAREAVADASHAASSAEKAGAASGLPAADVAAWRRFHEAARRLAALPRPERHQRLQALAQ